MINVLHDISVWYRALRLRLFRWHTRLFRLRLQRRTRITMEDSWQVGREFEKR